MKHPKSVVSGIQEHTDTKLCYYSVHSLASRKASHPNEFIYFRDENVYGASKDYQCYTKVRMLQHLQN